MSATKLLVLVDGFVPHDAMLPEDVTREGVYLVEVDARLPLSQAVAAAVDGCMSAYPIVESEKFSVSVHDPISGRQYQGSHDYMPYANAHHCQHAQLLTRTTGIHLAAQIASRCVEAMH